MTLSAVPADLSQFVQDEVASGRFADPDAVVTYALRLLQRDREEAVQGILRGPEDADAGRMQPLSAAFDDIRRDVPVAGT